MKNNLWITLIALVMALSSCITAAQFNNAEDDVYYSPKASNRKAPVMIPEVDVDEIIRQHPPQYGTPTNLIEDENYPNLSGSAYYPMYRAEYQNNPNDENPRISTSMNTAMHTETERLRRIHYGNSGSWDPALTLRVIGQFIELGLNTYPSSYYAGYNDYSYYYGPYNSYYWNGCGTGNHPSYQYNSPKNNKHTDENSGTSRRRTVVGNYTPPSTRDNDGRDGAPTTNRVSRGRYTAPALPQQEAKPENETRQASGRSTSRYTPSAPQQNLENVNGRQAYSRPREATQPATTTSSPERPTRTSGGWTNRTTETERPISRASQPTYTPSSRQQNTSSPQTVQQSSTGSGRGSAPANSGSSSGGRRR